MVYRKPGNNKKQQKDQEREKTEGEGEEEELKEIHQLLASIGYSPERLARGWRELHCDFHRF